MKIINLALLYFFLICVSSNSRADMGIITIFTPANESTFSQHDNVVLSYEAALGTYGDNIHLFIDGWHEGILRQPKGNANLGKLNPGIHKICLTINTTEQAPTGVENCVIVTSK